MSTHFRKSLSTLKVCLYLAALVIFSLPANRVFGGTVYDAVSDFSASANPNGVWSYGWSATLGGPLNLYTISDSTCYKGDSAWGEYPCSGGDIPPPKLSHNNTNHVISLAPHFPNITIPPTLLLLHPGPAGEYSVLRWTAPSSGLFRISTIFSGLDFDGPTSTDVHILVYRAKTQTTTYLLSSQIFYSYDLPLVWPSPAPGNQYLTARPDMELAAGDTVSVAVGFGVDGDYGFDSTGVEARITKCQR